MLDLVARYIGSLGGIVWLETANTLPWEKTERDTGWADGFENHC